MRKYLAPILILCVILLIAVSTAEAGEASLTWGAPTARVDGTPLPVSEIEGYTVYWGPSSRDYVAQMDIQGGDNLSYLVTDLPAGTWYFAVIARTTDGLRSGYSAEVSKTIAADPNPPTGLTVLAPALFVYTLVQTEDRIALVPVGTVPAGTPCDSSQSVRDSSGILGYVVPKSAVVWAGSVQAEVVVAECG